MIVEYFCVLAKKPGEAVGSVVFRTFFREMADACLESRRKLDPDERVWIVTCEAEESVCLDEPSDGSLPAA